MCVTPFLIRIDMNTYYLKKLRRKAKKFTRIQHDGYKKYNVQIKYNIATSVGKPIWQWKTEDFWLKTLDEAKQSRKNAEGRFILQEVLRVRNKRLAKL